MYVQNCKQEKSNKAIKACWPCIIALTGLMGSGKSSVSQQLARCLNILFIDSDIEIESIAMCSVTAFFTLHREKIFRISEQKIIVRLLEYPAYILALGGGSFIDQEVRRTVKDCAKSIWLKADLDVLFNRVTHSTHRPLLQGGNLHVLHHLMVKRNPIYATADSIIRSNLATYNIIMELQEVVAQHFDPTII